MRTSNILSALLYFESGRKTIAFVVNQAIHMAEAFKVTHRIEVTSRGLLVSSASDQTDTDPDQCLYVEADSDEMDVAIRLSALIHKVSLTFTAPALITLTDDEKALVRDGKMINAIKAVRDRFGHDPVTHRCRVSLKDAKDACDAYRDIAGAFPQ